MCAVCYMLFPSPRLLSVVFFLLGLLFVVDGQGQFLKRKNARVMIDARASDEFVKMRANHPDGLIYNMMKGRFFGGYTRDTSLEEMPFADVAVELARRLEQQEMFVAADIEEADLLLVVSWGTTDIPVDWSELFPGDEGNASVDTDEEDINAAEDAAYQASLDQMNQESMARDSLDMARLLGFDRALRSRGTNPQEYYELQSMLQDERYFVVVQAFDFQRLKETKEKVMLWSTRFSMDNSGVSFDEALVSLSRAAAPFMGENMDELSREKTHLGSGEGKVGELEVIGIFDEDEVEEGSE